MMIFTKRLIPDAVLPARGSAGAAGYDMTATSHSYDIERGIHTYGTGIAVEIPPGHVGYLFPRSSIYKTGLAMCNAVGVVDSDYRGEVTFKFYKADIGSEYRVGERIGQLIIMPIPKVEYVELSELSETARGTGGYGSTGA
jgi:dUTP pyrophosphatase